MPVPFCFVSFFFIEKISDVISFKRVKLKFLSLRSCTLCLLADQAFERRGTNRVMKLNAKISEIASPETFFDKKITSRVCHLHRQTRRSTVWASSEQNVGLVDFVPEFAEKRPRSGGRGGVGGGSEVDIF